MCGLSGWRLQLALLVVCVVGGGWGGGGWAAHSKMLHNVGWEALLALEAHRRRAFTRAAKMMKKWALRKVPPPGLEPGSLG